MRGEAKRHWMELCNQAANEQDSKKLLELANEMNRLLEEKEARLTKLGAAVESKE